MLLTWWELPGQLDRVYPSYGFKKIIKYVIFTILPSPGLIVVTVGKIQWDFRTSAQSEMERMCPGDGSVLYPHCGNSGRYL